MPNYSAASDTSSYNERVRSRRKVIRSFVSKYNKNRSPAERAADKITEFCGSIEFFVLNFVFSILLILPLAFLISRIPCFILR